MTTLRGAAQKALEALEDMLGWGSLAPQSVQASSKQSLQRLREALAQPEPEPVAIVVAAEYEDGSHAGHLLEWRGRNEANDYPEGTEFYTTPPQREPLTLEIHQPNESGSTLVTARWFVDTPHGWIGAWDREALEYILKGKE